MNQKEFSEKEMPTSIKLHGINPKRGKITDKQREWLEKYIKFVKENP